MDAPDIQTAVPVRRYAVGDYTGVLLHEITSRDAARYHFILAFVAFGESSPLLYITAEEATGESGRPATVVRVIAEGGARVLGPNERWCELDAFADDALQMACKVLGLEGEEPRRLL